jgi:WD40 repeat protein
MRPSRAFRLLPALVAPLLLSALVGGAAGQEKATLQERGPGRVVFLTLSGDGKVLASGHEDGDVHLWDVASGKELGRLRGHEGRALGLRFAPDGKRLTTWGLDRTVRSWAPSTGSELASVNVAGRRSWAVSPDGGLLAVGDDRDTVTLLSLVTGKETRALDAPGAGTSALTFSADGRLLAAGSREGRARVWALATGRPVVTFQGPKERIIDLTFSPDGKSLAVRGSTGQAWLWDATEGKQRASLERADQFLFAPDSRALVTRAEDGTARLWDVASGKLRATLDRPTPGALVAALDDRGKSLALGFADGTVKLWDVPGGKERAPLVGHTKRITVLAFSPGGAVLASESEDHTVRLWDVAGGKHRATLGGPEQPVRFGGLSPDGRLLVALAAGGSAKLWDVTGGKALPDLAWKGKRIVSCRFSPDGKVLATPSADGSVKLWALAPGGPTPTEGLALDGTVTFSPDGIAAIAQRPDGTVKLWGLADRKERAAIPDVAEALFSPDGRSLIVRTAQGSLKLWDVADGNERATLQQPVQPVPFLAFSAVGNVLVVGTGRGAARVYDRKAGKDRAVLTDPEGAILSVQLAPDGRSLTTQGAQGTTKLWDGLTGKLRAVLQEKGGDPAPLAYSGDGKVVAIGTAGGVVQLWGADTGKVFNTLKGHGEALWALGFTADGHTLVSQDTAGVVKRWDVRSGKELASFAEVNAVHFAPDRKALALDCLDGTIKVWAPDRGLSSFKKPPAFAGRLALSPGGKWVAAVDAQGKAWLWDGATGKGMVAPRGRKRWVSELAFSPDGNTLALGCEDEVVLLWDVARGKDRPFSPKGELIGFTPDGKTLAARRAGAVTLWDIESGKERHTIRERGLAVLAPDGQSLATGGPGGAVKLWSAAEGKLQAVVQRSASPITHLAVAPGGKLLATGSQDGTVQLWGLEAGKEVFNLGQHPAPIARLAFSADGTLLASAAEDGSMRAWSAPTGKEQAPLLGHKGAVRLLRFTASGGLVSVGPDGAWLWDSVTGERRAALPADAEYLFTPDGKALVTRGPAGTVTLWDTRGKARALHEHSAGVTHLAFTADGKALAAAGRTGLVKLFDAKGNRLHTLSGHRTAIVSVAFGPDGKSLATAGADGLINIWETATGAKRASLDGPPPAPPVPSDGKKMKGGPFHGEEGRATKMPAPEEDPVRWEGPRWAVPPLPQVAFGPSLLAVAGRDGTLKLWDVEEGRTHAVLQRPVGTVVELAFSADGKVMVTRHSDRTVKLWDVAGGRRRRVFENAEALALSPDGKLLALHGQDGKLRLWDVVGDREQAALDVGRRGRMAALAFSPNGKLLAGEQGPVVKVWGTASGDEVAELPGFSFRAWQADSLGLVVRTGGRIVVWDVVNARERSSMPYRDRAVVSRDGQTLVTANNQGKVTLWGLASGTENAVVEVGPGKYVQSLVLSPTGRALAIVDGSSFLGLHDARSGRKLASMPAYSSSSVMFSEDGQLLLRGLSSGKAQVWDLANNREGALLSGDPGSAAARFAPDNRALAVYQEGIIRLLHPITGDELALLADRAHRRRPVGLKAMHYSPDGKLLAVATSDGELKLWHAVVARERAILTGHRNVVQAVALSPEGKTVATGGFDHTVKLWDAATGKLAAPPEGKSSVRHKGPVLALACSADGALASASADRTVRLFDLETMQETAVLEGHTDAVWAVAFSGDGKTLATGSSDGTVKLWDARSGKLKATLPGGGEVFAVAISRDGKTLAFGGGDLLDRARSGTVTLWDVALSKPRATLRGHTAAVLALAFSEDGKTLASGGADGAVILWDEAGKKRAALPRQALPVRAVTFARGGQALVLALGDSARPSAPGAILTWDVATGRARPPLRGHRCGVACLALSADGKLLASGSFDSTVKLWPLEPEAREKGPLGR